jgi:hypothetical protein
MKTKAARAIPDTPISYFGGETHKPFCGIATERAVIPNNAVLLTLLFGGAISTLKHA